MNHSRGRSRFKCDIFYVQDIRSIETKDLLVKVEEFKKEVFSLRFQQATGQLENTARIKEVRKSIAKIKTVIRERELEK